MSTENDQNFDEGFSSPDETIPPQSAPPSGPPQMIWGMTENTYCMLMHLSQFLSFSGAGVIVPIVMWAINKDQSPAIDQHGKNILNFIISILIYSFVSGLLTLIVIGIIPLIAIVIAAIACPIIAAVKANNGEYWPYPLCIRFFK